MPPCSTALHLASCVRCVSQTQAFSGNLHPAVPCSSQFKGEDFQRWSGGFYVRLAQHMRTASQSIGVYSR